jgi:hypothetical protein
MTFRPIPKKYHAKLMRIRQRRLQGLIRGVAPRERRLCNVSGRSAVRRRRFRLIGIYKLRFGMDSFLESVSAPRLPLLERRMWLGRGYANWRKRLTLNSTVTPSGVRQ